MIARTATLALALLAATLPAAARPVTDDDLAAVAASLRTLQAASKNGEVMTAVTMSPPKVLDGFAQSLSLSREELLAMIETLSTEVMDRIEVVSVESRLREAEASETPSGRPYLVIPNEVVMRHEGESYRAETFTLAMEDEGAWYLMPTANAERMELLRKVYPDFAGIEFPRGRELPVE